jgi:CHAD domain-containing protein
MKRRVHRKTSTAGVAAYLREQLDAIVAHAPKALQTGDPKAIHQARVATRRLKALCDVAEPIVGGRGLAELNEFGRLLRKRLGDLRDLDVLRELLVGERSAGAKWLHEQFDRERADRLAKARRKLSAKSIARSVKRAGRLSKLFEKTAPALSLAVREAGHLRLDEFGALASTRDADLHELRIAGKLLRYTLEIARVDGAAVDESLVASFKSMQDDLGHWHDRAVLATRASEAIAEHELPLKRPGLACDLARLVERQVQLSQKDVAKFRKHWARRSNSIAAAIRKAMPLTRDVSKGKP